MITTETVLLRLNLTAAALYNWLKRNPQYRPQKRLGCNYLWSEGEIETLKQGRMETKKKHFQNEGDEKNELQEYI